MGNLIEDRVSFFLKDVPPFNLLEQVILDHIAHEVTVKYYESESFVFEEGETNSSFIYVLNQGNIKLTKVDSSSTLLIDQCEPGDVFGVRAVLTGNPYSMSAQCVEESLVYAIPSTLFQAFLREHQGFALFFANGYAAGQAIVREKKYEHFSQLLDVGHIEKDFSCEKKVVSCLAGTTIKEAASKMRDHQVGSIVIIDSLANPIGIVTDTDIRNKVVAENQSTGNLIETIMTSPVVTASPSISLSEAMMEMIRSGVHHLVITKDGSANTSTCGMVSDHDVMVSQKNHPASLIKSIKRSNKPEQWHKIRDDAEDLMQSYLQQGMNIQLIAGTITKINDTIIQKSVDLAIEETGGLENIAFCWLNLGSEGREEQLLRTDQDNAILFSDTSNNEQTQKKLLKIAERVNQILEQCGFEKCPAEIMARNPRFCLPLSQWKREFHQWITTPEPKALMHSTIFFDFRAGWGRPDLAGELRTYLLGLIKEYPIFLNFLAQNALQNPPPLSFFKNFLVERSGEHKNEFDIKKRGLMPLTDAARLLTLGHHSASIQNTIKRFQRLIELEPNNKDLYESAISAYELFLKHRTINGLNQGDSGRYITIDQMNKFDKQVLKDAFWSIKEIQDLIKVRFQQAYFN